MKSKFEELAALIRKLERQQDEYAIRDLYQQATIDHLESTLGELEEKLVSKWENNRNQRNSD